MPEPIITFLASFLVWFMFLGLLALWIIDGKLKKEQAMHAFASAIVAWSIAQMIKTLMPIPRPFSLNGNRVLTLTQPIDGAFPSTHTAIAFAIGIAVFLHDKRYGAIFLVASLLVGAGRVLGNVHYPVDILGGAAIGGVVAIAMGKVHFKT